MKLNESQQYKYVLTIKVKVDYSDDEYEDYSKDHDMVQNDLDKIEMEIADNVRDEITKHKFDLSVDGKAFLDYAPGNDADNEAEVVILSDHELTEDEIKHLTDPDYLYVDSLMTEYPEADELKQYEDENDTYIDDTQYINFSDLDSDNPKKTYSITKMDK